MIGAGELRELRRARRKPLFVTVHEGTEVCETMHQHIRDQISMGLPPSIWILPNENIELLDLRCLVGLTVLLGFKDIERGRQLFRAIQRLPASRIIVTDCETFTKEWVLKE